MKNKLLGFILLCCVSNVFALKTDATKPLQIEANTLNVDQKNMTSVFTGDVVITQGSLVAKSNMAVASQDKDGFRYVVLTGAPVTFKQLNDDGEWITGQGNKFDYNTKNNLAILTGRAMVKKKDNFVSGNQITYNTQTQMYSAASHSVDGITPTQTTSGRVTVFLQPQTKADSK